MNFKPVYLKQQEHTLENILILMLGKVCIQNSSNENIKLAPRAKIIHRLNFSLKLGEEETRSFLYPLSHRHLRPAAVKGSFRAALHYACLSSSLQSPVPNKSQTKCCSVTLQASNPLLWLNVSPGQSSHLVSPAFNLLWSNQVARSSKRTKTTEMSLGILHVLKQILIPVWLL